MESTPCIDRATQCSAGHELRTTEDIYLLPGERQLYPVGFRLNMPRDYFMLIRSRSSIAMRGIDVAAGVVDSDYRGIVRVLLCNNGKNLFEAKTGDSIAQGVIMKYETLDNATVSQPDSFDHAGFGSTGV